jgi:peroxiredoxin
VRIDKDYSFETDEGTASLADLFQGRSQLLMYHFMFGPEYTGGCPVCSTIADGFSGSVVHLENHDVTMMAVSQAPLEALQAYKRRMGWTFPWASSLGATSTSTSRLAHGGATANERRRIQLSPDQHDPVLEVAERGTHRDRRDDGNRRGDVHAPGPGHERVRARRWRRLPHVLRLRARTGRDVGHVHVARPRAQGAQTSPASRMRRARNEY